MAEQKKSNAPFVLLLIGSLFGILSFIGTVAVSLFPWSTLLEAYQLFGENSQALMLFSFFVGLIGILVCVTQLHLAFKIKEHALLKDFLYSLIISGMLFGLDAGIPAILILIGALIGAYRVGDKKELPYKLILFGALSGLIALLLGVIRYYTQKEMISSFSSILGESFLNFLNILFYASTILAVISSIIFIFYSFKLKERQTKKDYIILIIISIVSLLHLGAIIALVVAIKGLVDLKKKEK